jgi:hypothetical protein
MKHTSHAMNFSEQLRTVATIVALWFFLLVVLYLLQLVGVGLGFKIGPIGEDRNWIFFLQRHETHPVQKAFWEFDGRNPLAPWWYLAAKPLIEGTRYGISLVKKLTHLLVALSVYALLIAIGGREHKRLSVFAAAMSAMWMFSFTPSHIDWTMLVALSAGLLSLASYAASVDKGPQVLLYATSVILYLVAIATYTLQIAVPLGILGLGMLVNGNRAKNCSERVIDGISHAAPFGAVAILFLMMWVTTNILPIDATVAQWSFPVWFANTIRSITSLVWHPSHAELLSRPYRLPGPAFISALAGSLFLASVFAAVCHRLSRHTRERTTMESAHIVSKSALAVRIIVCLIAVSAGTVALEASNAVWVPGTRTWMLEAAVQPVLIASLIYFGLRFRFAESSALRRLEATAYVPVFGVIAMTSFGYNHTQNMLTRDSELIETGLKAIVPAITKPTMFLMLGFPAGVPFTHGDIFVKTFYKSTDVNLRIPWPGSAITAWEQFGDVVVGTDGHSLYTHTTIGAPKAAPQLKLDWIRPEDVIFIRYNGIRVKRLDSITPADVAGHRVAFRSIPQESHSLPGETTVINNELSRWQMAGAVIAGNEAQLTVSAGQSYSVLQHPLRFHAGATYRVLLEIKAVDPATALTVDLYSGAAYDAPAQDHAITGLESEYTTYTFGLPAGPNPPERGFIRLVSVSRLPVSVRRIIVSEVR